MNIDFTRVSVVLVGSHLLRPFGTHMSSKFVLQNLSCPAGLFLHPTSTFTKHGKLKFTGLIKSGQWGNLPVLTHNSFFHHLLKVAGSLKHFTPVIVEFDVSGFITAICGTRFKPTLDDEIAQYVQSYFVHFQTLLNTLPNDNVFEKNYDVCRQMPFQLAHLSTLDNLKIIKTN